MLTCFRSYLICRDKVCLYVDAPVSSHYKNIGLDSIIEGSFSWWQSANEDIYNRVIIEWVDPNNHYEVTTTVFEDSVDMARRGVFERSFTLRGITNAKQAGRMGAYLLDASAGVRNFCSFSISLQDADVEAGDVIALTHDLPGWENKWFRVVAITDNDSVDDSITLACSEYVAEIYNDIALDFPAHVDTNLPNSYECPDVVSLQATERVTVQKDGTILSDIDVSWVDPPVLLRSVEVLLLEQGALAYKSCGMVAPNTQNFVIRGLNPTSRLL